MYFYTMTLHFMQLLIDALHWQTYDIKITSGYGCHPDIAYPFLNSIGTSFVKWLILIYIIMYILVGKFLERHIGCHGE